jgi:3-hydroxyisobutyrate dehydrogenase
MKKNIGVIGAGSMGMAMALNLQKKGFHVVIRDIRNEVETKARAHNLDVANSPAALADKVEFIIISVVNAAQAHQVLFDKEGVTTIAAAGKTILLTPTIAPEDTEAISKQLLAHGYTVLDAPVSGGPVRAQAGTMSLMLTTRFRCFIFSIRTKYNCTEITRKRPRNYFTFYQIKFRNLLCH